MLTASLHAFQSASAQSHTRRFSLYSSDSFAADNFIIPTAIERPQNEARLGQVIWRRSVDVQRSQLALSDRLSPNHSRCNLMASA